MKLDLIKRLPLSIVVKITAVITIVFSILSIIYIDNWLLRLSTQVSVCLVSVLNGIDTVVFKKQKVSGYLLFGAAVLMLVVIIQTIIVGLKIGAL